MKNSNVAHCNPGCEIALEDGFDLQDGVPESQYYGQSIWDGKNLVTEKEWEWQQREKNVLRQGE
jgi:hypothetical protein